MRAVSECEPAGGAARKKRSAPEPVGLQARQATDCASASGSLVEDPDEAFEAPWTLCPV